MNFTWDEMLDGLDTSLDVVKTVAAIVPGGQSVALGASVLDTVVEKVNEKDPVETSISILEAATKSQTKNVGINNDIVLTILNTVASSTHNKIDDKLLCLVKSYLECENK